MRDQLLWYGACTARKPGWSDGCALMCHASRLNRCHAALNLLACMIDSLLGGRTRCGEAALIKRLRAMCETYRNLKLPHCIGPVYTMVWDW